MSAPRANASALAPTHALSIQQPWAWLIVRPDVTDAAARTALLETDELKGVENRTWRTARRGRIAIHAGQKVDRHGLAFVRAAFPGIALPSTFAAGGIVGHTTIIDCVDALDSRWFVGPFGFVLRDTVPVPFLAQRGQLGFFRLDTGAA